MNRNRFLKLAAAFVPAVALLFSAASSASANLTGAIFTTTSDGTKVNGNIYDDCEDVYLNGGPQNRNANGLPEGTYYFQVTDPSGKVLLSTDSIENRKVVVGSNGRIIGVPTDGGTYHLEGADNPANGSKPVQLWPFDETPNNGGVYKAWLTKVEDYTPSAGVFGFVPSASKTDNFKCKHDDDDPKLVSAELVITKFYDANANGVNNSELALDGFRYNVTVTDNEGNAVELSRTFIETGLDGVGRVVVVTGNLTEEQFPLDYQVSEILPGTGVANHTWVQTKPANGLGYQGKIAFSSRTESLEFGNVCLGPVTNLSRTMGYWANQGNSLITTNNWLGALNALKPVNESGAVVTFTSAADVSRFLTALGPPMPRTWPTCSPVS
jgi:hypothetical protein